LESNIIFEVALMMLAGLVFGRLGKFIKLPNVTGYLVAGLLLGPSLLNLIPISMVHGFAVISDIALAFIAFSIGSEFSLEYFREVGIAPFVIALAESFGAMILVTVVLLLFGADTKLAIMLGAIAAATAPAQTIMVIKQFGAKGPLTSMLMSVAAIDDAVALIGFGIATAAVKIMSADTAFHIVSLLKPLYEIGISFLCGAVVSIIMKFLFRWFKKQSNRICIITGAILLTYWLSSLLDGSSLLACMALGAFLVNIFENTDDVVETANSFSPPILLIFFVISGAGFDVSILGTVGIIGILYVVMRVAGKMFGAWLGSTVTKQDQAIRRYLGPTLMPQAGVALGLIIVAGKVIPDYAGHLRTIILSSTFVYSIIGPIAAKFALKKSGELVIPPKKKKADTA